MRWMEYRVFSSLSLWKPNIGEREETQTAAAAANKFIETH